MPSRENSGKRLPGRNDARASGSAGLVFPSLVTGFILGGLLVCLLGAVLFVAKIAALSTAMPPPGLGPVAAPSLAAVATQTLLPPPTQLQGTPTSSPAPDVMGLAEASLERGDASTALELLLPLLDQLDSARDLARLNTDLARAEFLLGHFQRAAGYYEAAFAMDPDPTILFQLASAYDLGGDLHSALARYLRLADSVEATEDLRQIARERAREIVSVLGTPTPGP